MFVVLLVASAIASRGGGSGERKVIDYSDLVGDLAATRKVRSADISNTTGRITGELTIGDGPDAKVGLYRSDGPSPSIGDDVKALGASGAKVRFTTDSSNPFLDWLPLFLLVGLMIGVMLWTQRKAQSQVGGLMSIGRSKAKVYTTERPKTTFADVAGYEGAKLEIREVVDFLRNASKFKELGAKIPKGVLLVGPPGTGKTLLARAVAGEAGVTFISVTGSDFMEMFVGVGASRVRDLFQTARKQSPAIIFIDEIDSIGRRRGAGLSGGHDERDQTLNQMLSEMDGFEATEGVVMIAATNRPDVLDPALLRPGRFDRQVVIPLPDLAERLPILLVHANGKRIGPDVDLRTVARGTPGMSGADLANLVNEAALHAVRRGGHDISMADFEAARDRVLMGQRRESTVLSERERDATAFHEGGHAVCAYVLPNADPVHKVTILPTGMALGATQQLPLEERHTYWKEYLEDTLAVMMGGRCAEKLVLGSLSTGAGDDLQRATAMARKMVREFGMSERIGPMAWGGQQAFLGDDPMGAGREYADETARVIDQEVERILRSAEARSTEVLTAHRRGLDALADALLAKETVDGAEVARLVDSAFGRPVHSGGPKSIAVPRFADALGRTPPPPPRPPGGWGTPRYAADYGRPAQPPSTAGSGSPSHPQPAPPPAPPPVATTGYRAPVQPTADYPAPPPSQPPYDLEQDPSWSN